MSIQVPPKLYSEIVDYVTYNILWFLRDRFTPAVRKQFPEHWKAFQSYVEDMGAPLPKAKHPNKNTAMAFDFNTDGMKPQYQKLTPKQDKIRVGLDWEGTMIGNKGDTRAAWIPSKWAILVYLNHNPLIQDYAKRGSHPANIVFAIDELKEILKHELEHVVQDYLLPPKQSKKLPNYSEHKKDYYTSPIEFEPQITTAVTEFIHNYVIVRESKPVDLGKVFRQFVGMAPAARFDPFSVSPFFKYLKSNPKQYKIAVRKFYLGVKDKLEKMR